VDVRVGGIFQMVGVVDCRFPRTRHCHHRYYLERVALLSEHFVAAPGVEQAPSGRGEVLVQLVVSTGVEYSVVGVVVVDLAGICYDSQEEFSVGCYRYSIWMAVLLGLVPDNLHPPLHLRNLCLARTPEVEVVEDRVAQFD
jgi:hypothetical protein